MTGVKLFVKQPIRKCWQHDEGSSVFLTIPKEFGIKDGDFVEFSITDGQITLRKVEV